MRRIVLLPLLALVGSILFSCSSSTPDPSADITPTFTIREIMQSMVEPRADTLWNAVSVSVTEKGVETNAPSTDEEWDAMRHEAVTLSEAMNLILMPERKVAKPGEQAKDPNVELSPDQISTLIDQDRESWVKLAHALQDSVTVAIQAIDSKNPDALSDAGAGIDAACETCHKKYWYPNDQGAPAK